MANPFDPTANPYGAKNPYGNVNFASVGGNAQQPVSRPLTNLPSQPNFSPYGVGGPPLPSSTSSMSEGGSEGGGFKDIDYGGMSSALGDYFKAQSDSQAQANKQYGEGAAALAQSINDQSKMAQGGAEKALAGSGPDKTVAPFAQMAIRKALIDSLGDNTNNAGGTMHFGNGLDSYVPKMTGGGSLQGVKDAAAQFYSPQNIQASMAQYGKALSNVDPYAPQMNLQSVYGVNPDTQAKQNDLTNWSTAAQQRRLNSNDSANAALKQALEEDQGPGIWSKIGGAALIAAPYVAAPFTGGASLAFAPAASAAGGALMKK